MDTTRITTSTSTSTPSPTSIPPALLAPATAPLAAREPPRLLHPRLAHLDPVVRGETAGGEPGLLGRARLVAGTLGACLMITFAASAFPGPPATTPETTAAARTATAARVPSVAGLRLLALS